MPSENTRSLYQILIMISVLTLGIATGCFWIVFSCLKGSDHSQANDPGMVDTRSVTFPYGPGEVERWHDFLAPEGTVQKKDLDYWKSWFQENNIIIGLQIPTAPGAVQPGILTTDTHQVVYMYGVWPDVSFHAVELISDDNHAGEIAELFPPSEGTHWKALVPENKDWLASIPTQTLTITNANGWINYTLDFLVDDPCNGCEVNLTFCTDYEMEFGERLALNASGIKVRENPGGLTCLDPINTYITLYDWINDELLPAEPFAAFSSWGGTIYTATRSTDFKFLQNLVHSSPVTETFQLETIRSEKGWSYAWEDLNETPITSIDVNPGQFYSAQNVIVHATGLPACTITADTINITATHATESALQATSSIKIGVLPQLDGCTIIDVGIEQVVSSEIITAGNWVTYTLTISNYEEYPTNVVVTSTLSPLAGIVDVSLPEDCTRNGSESYCQILDVPANGGISFDIGVKAGDLFRGVIKHYARVGPVEAIDERGYDNYTGPLDIIVVGKDINAIYLPVLAKMP